MTTRIYMVRHAKSPYSNGQEKTRPISSQGVLASEALVELFKGIQVTASYSSDYKRAQMTVEALTRHYNLTLTSLESLRERKLKPSHIDLPYKDFIETISQSFDDIDYKIYNCESVRDVQIRGIKTIENILKSHAEKNIIIGTHGNFMTAVFNYYDQSYGFEFWQQSKMPDVYEMTFEGMEFVSIKRLE